LKFPDTLYPTVAFTTVAWLAATFATRPVEWSTLVEFFRTVRPGGLGWRPIARVCRDVRPDSGLFRLFVDWLAGVVLVYSALFAVGNYLLGDRDVALLLAGLVVVSGAWVWWDLARKPRGGPQTASSSRFQARS